MVPSSLFSDLLVIDCASFIAGPAAGTIFSDFGARVIKIEPPEIGDSYRRLMSLPGIPPAEQNYFWLLTNRGKQSLALDLKQDAAREVLKTLIAKADVFITNFPFPIRERLKLRYEDLANINDRLIYASLSPYGEDGEEKDRTGYDATAWWARSGLMDSVRATPESEPALSVPGMGDHPTAVALYAAIVSALYRREKTGKGGSVSTSLLANGLWSNGCWMQAVLCDADFTVRLRRGQRSALTELYRCKDGRWFMLAMVNSTREWPLLCMAIGKSEWIADPRFATPDARRENSGTMVHLLEDVFAMREWSEWRQLFANAAITFGPITQSGEHVDCPQVAANGLLPEIEGMGGLRTVNSPLWIDGEDKRPPQRAPDIGEHSRHVLESFGYDARSIDALIRSGVVA